MSRIGKKPITIPQGVDVRIENNTVHVKGKLGSLSRELNREVEIAKNGSELSLSPKGNSKRIKSLWGLERSLISNMVTGVSQGFTKSMEIIGVGYRAAVQGNTLNLSLGLSHPVAFEIPSGIKIAVEKNTKITVSGADAAQVGQVCANIRSYRPPEPYKGKGIRYAGEHILRKEGKKK